MSARLTAADLAAIAARAASATPGPWHVCNHAPDLAILDAARDDCDREVAAVPMHYRDRIPAHDDDNPRAWDDAEFIAHARMDIPALLAECAALRADYARLAAAAMAFADDFVRSAESGDWGFWDPFDAQVCPEHVALRAVLAEIPE